MCLGTAGSVHAPLGLSTSSHTRKEYISAQAYLTPCAHVFVFSP